MSYGMVQVFSHHLSLLPASAAALAAELVQEPFEGTNPWEKSGPSLVKQLHTQLLTVVGPCYCQQQHGCRTHRFVSEDC